jgi:hypothetical protein
VQAGIAEMKVTCYTAIALCCKKLTHVIDNSPAVQAFKQQQQRHGKIKGQTRNYLGQDKTILGQALQVRRELLVDMIAYGFKAASVIEDLESITPNPSKPIRNNKRVEIIKEIERTRKHSFTKWFCLMRSKVRLPCLCLPASACRIFQFQFQFSGVKPGVLWVDFF